MARALSSHQSALDLIPARLSLLLAPPCSEGFPEKIKHSKFQLLLILDCSLWYLKTTDFISKLFEKYA